MLMSFAFVLCFLFDQRLLILLIIKFYYTIMALVVEVLPYNCFKATCQIVANL